MFKSKCYKRDFSSFCLILFIIQSIIIESLAYESRRNIVPNAQPQTLLNKQVSNPRTTNSEPNKFLKPQNGTLPISQARNSPYDGSSDDTRVPFWNIAHMINSIDQIEPALRDGANGIEVDISFDKRGFPTDSYHGFPCDCGRHCFDREDLVRFVQHVARVSTHPATSPLQLIVLDLKLKDLNAQQKEVGGRQLAAILHENLYKRYQQQVSALSRNERNLMVPPVRVIVSINHVADHVLVRSFLNYMIENRLDFMGNNVGFDVGMNDELNEISDMWKNFQGLTLNIWQGDGLTNCANIIRGVDRLKDAINIRNNQGHFRKIYYWTADVMYQIRSILRLGIDAMLTNQPQRIIQVLNEPEFRDKYRLATHYDNPFAQFWIEPSAWKMSAPTLDEVEETVSNIKKTSANFVKTLPDGIAAVIKKVHNTIVSPK